MLTLVTINYNGTDDTIALLRSLERQTDTLFDVIVVDNNSSAGERERLATYGAGSSLRLDVIYADRNRGFSGGNNIGIRKAMAQGTEWVLLINNDTTVTEDFVSSLRASIPSEPSLVAIALDEGDRTAFAGQVRWLAATLQHAYAPVGRKGAYVIGAGMLIHRLVLEQVGLLDEEFFLYFEDADYTLRVRSSGFPVVHLRAPGIRHFVSSATKQLGSPLLLRYHMRNAIRFNHRHGPLWVTLALPVWLTLIAIKQLVKIAVGRAREESWAILAGIIDAVAGRWGRIRTEPVIAVECESLEDTSWGVARLIRGLLIELAARPELVGKLAVDLYFKAVVPDETWLRSPLFRTRVVRAPRWLPVPISFSLYYYVILPLRLWLDRPDVTYWPNYMLPIIAPQPSVVMLTEDIWHEMRNPHRQFRYRAGYLVFANWAARMATRVMAISHASAESLQRLFDIPATRIAVNQLAVPQVDPETFPMSGSYVLYVGQALERRHVRETMLAFEQIASEHPKLDFIAIGPDKYDPRVIDATITEMNARMGRPAVRRIEHVSDADLHRYYRGALACVYVSEIEAFGLPPLEAFSYGAIPVLADTALTREIYGDFAIYTRSSDVRGIASALTRAVTDMAERDRILQGAQEVLSRYTWRAHADRMLGIISATIPTIS